MVFATHIISHCTYCIYLHVVCIIVVSFIYSRTLAPVAISVICWLYPTQNKFYLILSYLSSSCSTRRGRVLRLLFILSTYILVCFSEHGYSYVPGCSAFYTTVDASGSYCDRLELCVGWARTLLLMTKKALRWLSIIFHRDWYGFLFFPRMPMISVI